MPKCYSDQERAYIVKRLKEEAAKCLSQYGVRHTTVDELVKRVKIPKGTFYLFYKSKELLLFDVILEQHELIEQEIFQAVSSIEPDRLTADQLTDMLLRIYTIAAEAPVLRMLNSDEVEILARKLPEDVVEAHLGHDSTMSEKLLSMLPVKTGVDAKALGAAFRAIYMATLHKEEIGEPYYEGALRYLIRGLVVQLL
nr:TetR/AcrR family transcriptional regulator [Ruminococcus sp. OA3]